MKHDSLNTTNNPYLINCLAKRPVRDFEAKLDQGKLVVAAGFQEAPTLTEINERDGKRIEALKAQTPHAKVHDSLMMSKIETTESSSLREAYQTALAGQRLSG